MVLDTKYFKRPFHVGLWDVVPEGSSAEVLPLIFYLTAVQEESPYNPGKDFPPLSRGQNLHGNHERAAVEREIKFFLRQIRRQVLLSVL